MKNIILPVFALMLSTYSIASTTDFSCEITGSEYRLPKSVDDDFNKYPRNYFRKIDFQISTTMDGKKSVQTLTDSIDVNVKKVKRTTVNGWLNTFAISFEKIQSEEVQSIVRKLSNDDQISVSESIRLPTLEFDLEKWKAMKYIGSTYSVAKGKDSEGESVKYRIEITCVYPL